MHFGYWHLLTGRVLRYLPEILPDAQRPVKCCDGAVLRAMARRIGGDGLDAFEIGYAAFERQAVVADASPGASSTSRRGRLAAKR